MGNIYDSQFWIDLNPSDLGAKAEDHMRHPNRQVLRCVTFRIWETKGRFTLDMDAVIGRPADNFCCFDRIPLRCEDGASLIGKLLPGLVQALSSFIQQLLNESVSRIDDGVARCHIKPVELSVTVPSTAN